MIIGKNIIPEGKSPTDKTLRLAMAELKLLWIKRFGRPRKTRPTTMVAIHFEQDPLASGFSVGAGPNSLTFRAATAVEILYAVYDFAEEFLGFCFFEPGVDRVVKKSAAMTLHEGMLIFERRPQLKNRGFIQEFPFDEKSYLVGDWMAKNKLNYLLTWMKYYDDIPQKMKTFYRLRGIEIESGHHNFDYWIPPEKYYRNHPEFFAVINGKRITPRRDRNGFLMGEQLCTTNPMLRQEIVKNMTAYCRKRPELKNISLIPNDGFGWCECEECAKHYDRNRKGERYSLSEHVYKADRIYHELIEWTAAELQKHLPEVTLTFCAYINYCAPSPGFRLRKNTAVHFAPYWRCINHKINDSNCPINSRYADDLKQWLQAKDGGEVNLYEYYMGINLYVSLPMIHHEKIFEEIAWYGAEGVDGVLTQFHPGHWSVYGLNYYMMAKAAYGATKETSVRSAMAKLFGRDRSQAEAFYAGLAQLVENAGRCHIPYPEALLRRTTLPQFLRLYGLAEELQKQGAKRDHLRRDLLCWMEYLVRFKELFDRYHQGKLSPEELESFLKWAQGNALRRIVIPSKLEMLLSAWKEGLIRGKPWLHFNLDWEDHYIRKHHQTLK